jgi:hypothetical protein
MQSARLQDFAKNLANSKFIQDYFTLSFCVRSRVRADEPSAFRSKNKKLKLFRAIYSGNFVE